MRIKEKMSRNTPQRAYIYRFIKQSKLHVSAEDVYDKLKKSYPMLSLATVYRNLKFLAHVGKIQEYQFRHGMLRYDPRTDLHGHFICDACENITDVDLPEKICPAHFGAYQAGIVRQGTVQFYGLCKTCLNMEHQ